MGGPWVQGGRGGGLPYGGAHRPAWLPMNPVASSPPPAGGGSSTPTPCGTGGPGPRGRALPGPTFAAPGAACGSSAATTVPGRGRGLGRRSGRGWVWLVGGDWWRWRARGSPHSVVPWGCVGSGGVGECGPGDVRSRSPPWGWVGTRSGGSSKASAGFGLTSRVGRGAGTLLLDPGAVLLRSGLVCGPGVRAFRDGRRRRIAPRLRRAPP